MKSNERTLTGITTANLFNPKCLHNFMSSNIHLLTQDIAIEAGYDGFELFLINRQNMKLLHSDRVLSLHQSFAQFKPWDLTSPNMFGRSILMPQQKSQFHLLEKASKNLWGKPAVLYHDSPSTDAFTKKEIQIQPHVFKAWGVGCLDGFIDIAKQKGFDGICFDTTHSLNSSKQWNLGLLPQMLETVMKNNFLSSMHASFSRKDHLDITTPEQMNWMREMLLNGKESELSTVINMAYLAKVDRIIVEIIPSAIWEYLGKRNLFLGKTEMVQIHKRIRENLEDKFN